jgi:protein translocase SecG subunit
MVAFISIIILLASVMAVIVVLLQPGKGDLTATFGGLSSQFGSMFGMTKTKNILTTITKVIVGVLFVLALLVNKFFVGSVGSSEQQVIKPMTEGAKAPASNMTPPPVQSMPGATPKK